MGYREKGIKPIGYMPTVSRGKASSALPMVRTWFLGKMSKLHR